MTGRNSWSESFGDQTVGEGAGREMEWLLESGGSRVGELSTQRDSSKQVMGQGRGRDRHRVKSTGREAGLK